jgi:hypothetical protein
MPARKATLQVKERNPTSTQAGKRHRMPPTCPAPPTICIPNQKPLITEPQAPWKQSHAAVRKYVAVAPSSKLQNTRCCRHQTPKMSACCWQPFPAKSNSPAPEAAAGGLSARTSYAHTNPSTPTAAAGTHAHMAPKSNTHTAQSISVSCNRAPRLREKHRAAVFQHQAAARKQSACDTDRECPHARRAALHAPQTNQSCGAHTMC